MSNLTYMAALATGAPSRDVILEMTVRQEFKTGVFFHQVYLLSKRLGFEYARAFRMVARKAGATSIKNLLLRFAGAISSGISEADFLAQEAKVEREQYINGYYRSLESLAKWGDAYAALLVSVSLVVVVAMMSTMLSTLGNSFVLLLTGAMTMVSSFGVYIIFRVAPIETRTFQNRRGPPERQWSKRLLFTVVPAGALIGMLLAFSYGFHMFLLILGFSLLPSGIMAWVDNGKVNRQDQEAAPFIRSLGNVTASLGTTLGAALIKIDRRSLGTLEPAIRRLQVRVRRNLTTEKAWDAFRDEVGSELMNRTTHMFVDGVTLGGPAERVGAIASEFAMDAALMRARRNVAAAPFAFLVIPLHFAMTGLMVFVLEIMKAFNARITEASEELAANSAGSGLGLLPSLPVFQSHDMSTLALLTLVALISMTISNALAPKFALGGHYTNMAFFGGITCIMTGFNMFAIPPVASSVMLPGGVSGG
jgi:flagellar protein FlaJ